MLEDLLDLFTKATCGPILELTVMSQRPRTQGCTEQGGQSRGATWKIAIIGPINVVPNRPGRHSGFTVIPSVSLAKGHTLMGQKVGRKMTLEAECWFYARWVSVTSDFPLAPAGISSRHPEGSQRGRMRVREMEP